MTNFKNKLFQTSIWQCMLNWTHDLGVTSAMLPAELQQQEDTSHFVYVLDLPSVWFLLLGSGPKRRWLIPGCRVYGNLWDQLWNAAFTCEESRVMFMRLSTKLHSRLNGRPQHPTSISFMRNQMPFRSVCVWTRTHRYVCSYVCICTKTHN